MGRYATKARMSKQELILVKYVVRQLTAAYTDARGKGRYARSMDQVMKDIFGIKRFTKCLERGIRNESDMISLMRALDFQTIWTICRSSEHYRMLCSLVAMDSAIVKLQKKSDEYLTLNPQDRPGRKYAKAQKELKRLQKSYNRTVKVFREIFDIKSKNAGSTIRGIMEYAESWRDRNTMGDDIFNYFDDSPMMDTVESMDEFVRRQQRGGRDVKRPERGGALGIDDDLSFAGPDDDDDYFSMDDDQPSSGFTSENMDELVERLAAIIQQRPPKSSMTPPAAPSMPRHPTYTYPNVPAMAPPPPTAQNDVFSRMLQMQEQQGQLLGQLIDVLSGGNLGGGGGEIWEEDLGDVMTRRAPGSDLSMQEALELANGGTLPPDAPEEDPPPAENASPKAPNP